MTKLRTAILVLALGAGLVGLLASDAVTVGIGLRARRARRHRRPASTFVEVKWPFPRDQWGDGRAFRCAAADCGVEVSLYLRPKIGFCNCDTGVADEAELDRVGDLELFSPKFVGLTHGDDIQVGWMRGLSRIYQVDIPYDAAAPDPGDGVQPELRRDGRHRRRAARPLAAAPSGMCSPSSTASRS